MFDVAFILFLRIKGALGDQRSLLLWLACFFSGGFLAVGLLAFHFGAANAPGESKADVVAGEGTFACGRIIGVDAFAACADGAEKVCHVEEEGESVVKEVGACTAVEGEVGVDGGEEGLGAAAVGGVGEEL